MPTIKGYRHKYSGTRRNICVLDLGSRDDDEIDVFRRKQTINPAKTWFGRLGSREFREWASIKGSSEPSFRPSSCLSLPDSGQGYDHQLVACDANVLLWLTLDKTGFIGRDLEGLVHHT